MDRELVIQRLNEYAGDDIVEYLIQPEKDPYPGICMDCGFCFETTGPTLCDNSCSHCGSEILWHNVDFINYIVKNWLDATLLASEEG